MLDVLIVEGKQLKNELKNVPSPDGVIRTYSYSFLDNAKFEVWKNKSLRFLSREFQDDRCIADFETGISQLEKSHLNPKVFDKLIAILESCTYVDKIVSNAKTNKESSSPISISLNQNQTQSQTQTQELVQHIFLEAIKDELTGKQQKEIKAIIEQESDFENAKPKIIDKLKSFGENTLSNILANIITNPTIWGSF